MASQSSGNLNGLSRRNKMTTQELQDIFEAYSLETPDINDLSILQRYIEKYPQYKKELTEYAAEGAMLKFDLETEISDKEKNRVAELTRRNFDKFWAGKETRIQSIESLITAAKSLGMKKQEFAKRIGLNPSQLFNLEVRQYIFSTIPTTLIETVAETLQTTKETIENFLSLTPSVAANYKSQDRPDELEQISFAQAIKEDETLTDEEKNRLLNLK